MGIGIHFSSEHDIWAFSFSLRVYASRHLACAKELMNLSFYLMKENVSSILTGPGFVSLGNIYTIRAGCVRAFGAEHPGDYHYLSLSIHPDGLAVSIRVVWPS